MSIAGVVQFVGVEVLDEDDLVLLCLIGRTRHWIGVGRLQLGSTVAHRGDRGLLVLEQQFALDMGLPAVPRALGPNIPVRIPRRQTLPVRACSS